MADEVLPVKEWLKDWRFILVCAVWAGTVAVDAYRLNELECKMATQNVELAALRSKQEIVPVIQNDMVHIAALLENLKRDMEAFKTETKADFNSLRSLIMGGQ